MNINNISFGRIVKVNAPRYIASKIANIANSNSRKQISKQIKSIFPDKNQHECKVKYYTDCNGETYLLSGPDSKFTYMAYKSSKNSKTYSKIVEQYINSHYNGAQINADYEGTNISKISYIF